MSMQANNSSNGGARKVFNSARHAARWLERGIYPVPLEARTKRPKGEKNGSAKGAENWNKLRVTEDTIQKYFKNGDNIGGLWGEPSAWAIDIDLDTPEAQSIARDYLPETLIYGREQAPGSHYIFRCTNAETKKYFTREIGMIVEIRSTGSQSVLPGSTHPTGDRYRIDHDVDIADIKWGELKRLVSKIAGASIAAHYYPEEGGRHDYVHALTGALLHSHWKDDDIRKFMKSVRSAVEDEEDQSDRDGTVENTIKSYRNGGNVQGWPTLSQFMPTADLAQLKRYLGIGNELPDVDPAPDSITSDPFKIPDNLLHVPGLVGEVTDWTAKFSFIQQPIFSLAVGLMAVAMATRNKYRIKVLHTPLQPYFMCVAPTSSGKGDAMKAMFTIAERLGLKDQCFKQSQSYHAMLDMLVHPPHTAVWLWEESALYLKHAARSVSSPEHQVLSHMISMYGMAADKVPGIPARKNPIPALDHPFFCVVGFAQPPQLVESISNTDMSVGLVNRFLLFDAGEGMVRDNERRVTKFPTELEQKLKGFDKIKVAEGEFINIDYETTEAYDTINDLRTYQREAASKIDRGNDVWGRAHQNALIVAGIVAVGCNPREPVITEEIARWAVNFVCWSVDRWLTRIDQSSARSFTERNQKHIERLIYNARSYVLEARDPKERALLQRGFMPQSVLARKCQFMKGREMNEIVTHMILGELICPSEEDDRICYWPKTPRQQAPRL